VLPKLAKLYGGRILGDGAVQHLRAACVRIEADPPAVIQADGQIVGMTPAEFSVARQALWVRVP
jgi:diacylglycerol kinase family enzyme